MLGNQASYTFTDNRLMVSQDSIYRTSKAYKIKGIIIAQDPEYYYLKTKYGILKKLKCFIQLQKPQS